MLVREDRKGGSTMDKTEADNRLFTTLKLIQSNDEKEAFINHLYSFAVQLLKAQQSQEVSPKTQAKDR